MLLAQQSSAEDYAKYYLHIYIYNIYIYIYIHVKYYNKKKSFVGKQSYIYDNNNNFVDCNSKKQFNINTNKQLLTTIARTLTRTLNSQIKKVWYSDNFCPCYSFFFL